MERPLEKSARPRLLDQVRDAIRVRHYSYETEKAYVYWVRFFIRFSGLRHPEELHEDDVGRFLTFLAVARRVSPSTQNQALNALVFLYKHVLQRPLGHIGNAARAKPRERLPVVFTPSEVQAIVSRLDGLARVIVCLLYGSGLRLMECLRLRIKDIDFERNEITVRDGKGGKDRVTILSSAIKDDLRGCIQRSKNLHDYDLAEGYGEVSLPHALDKKYPRAARELCWQYVFPAERRSVHPISRKIKRHHVLPGIARLHSAARQTRHDRRRRPETRKLPHLPALVRDAHPGKRLRHSDRPGITRPQGRQHHHDLHARRESRRPWRAQPARWRYPH